MIATGNRKLSNEVSVYLLAENRLLRDTLARLLRKRSEMTVVGVGDSAETAKEVILGSNCDVVLMDSFDHQACSYLLSGQTQDCGFKLLLFGMDNDKDVFLRAVHLGICGYLLKDASAAEIVAAVRAAARGEATCPPSLCMTLIQYVSNAEQFKSEIQESAACSPRVLTPRQLQLLRLVALGLTNKEIAANLNLSEFTVKNHLRRVMRQVEATSRHDAVDFLRASGQLASNEDTMHGNGTSEQV
jgi:DNA-binding NarL/FixJ family response regulator